MKLSRPQWALLILLTTAVVILAGIGLGVFFALAFG